MSSMLRKSERLIKKLSNATKPYSWVQREYEKYLEKCKEIQLLQGEKKEVFIPTATKNNGFDVETHSILNLSGDHYLKLIRQGKYNLINKALDSYMKSIIDQKEMNIAFDRIAKEAVEKKYGKSEE